MTAHRSDEGIDLDMARELAAAILDGGRDIFERDIPNGTTVITAFAWAFASVLDANDISGEQAAHDIALFVTLTGRCLTDISRNRKLASR